MINIDVALPKSKSKVHFVPLIYAMLYLKKEKT
ncbi:hypothetical protein X928_04830 [Petrotoga miotherma DSM 10691]|uniref:Uncharacterized protein n=1 Tax=Petrotoga miotherma DSM 10691 TaxID=1434326 RepID=A0A2K1PCR0_9BACT|nr:hypothetical protein X928_04830 [Petrotoga miotherma DSM 10691]